MLFYADDSVIISETREDLQLGLKSLENYNNRFRLKVNTSKTKIVIFHKGGRLAQNNRFFYNGEEISVESKFKYLGIVMSSGGSFSITQKTLAEQAQKAMFCLFKKLQPYYDISFKLFFDLFDKLIKPILCYASEIWGFNRGNAVEKVHMKFCKKVLGLKWNTENNFIYCELKRVNMQCERYVYIVKYWLRLLKSSKKRLIKNVYNNMFKECLSGKKNWAFNVKSLLEQHGFGFAWIFQGVGNETKFLKCFKNRLRDNFGQILNDKIQNSSRGKFYSLFNNFFTNGHVDYHKIVKNPLYRRALIKFRTLNHRLEIETGRWHKPLPIPLNDRKCMLCKCVEDELHFLLICPLLSELRQKYIPNFYYHKASIFKLKMLMISHDYKTINNLAEFFLWHRKYQWHQNFISLFF